MKTGYYLKVDLLITGFWGSVKLVLKMPFLDAILVEY